jgi:predicted nucleotidyltransferase
VGELDNRRSQTNERVEKLRGELRAAESIIAGKACVYATGSVGRREASLHSDLDLFILAKSEVRANGKESLLTRLDSIRVKADLIEATDKLGFPEFSGDGKYLTAYAVHELIDTLGSSRDDVENTFTARLLLLLESLPLLESEVYDQVTAEVIAAYWKDYDDYQENFMPAFLCNDILRLWRTFCVNYEAKRTAGLPTQEKAKAKLKNYKLKHSRILTCYSAVLYLLALHTRQCSVSQTDVVKMIKLSPTRRLEWLRDQSDFEKARSTTSRLLSQYNRFLETTNATESELVGLFSDKVKARQYMEAASAFGDTMFEAMNLIGNENRFHRLLVV